MEIAPHGATDGAAIVHLKDFFISVDHEVVIYAFLSEFADNDGVAPVYVAVLNAALEEMR